MSASHSTAPVASDHQAEVVARVKAIESIMIEKGLMTTEAVDRLAEIYENEVGPQLGAKVVAVQDQHGEIRNDDGIDVEALTAHVKRGEHIEAFPGAEPVTVEPRRPLIARLGLGGVLSPASAPAAGLDPIGAALEWVEHRSLWSRFGL